MTLFYPLFYKRGFFLISLALHNYTLLMLLFTLQIDPKECIDCVQHATKGDWTHALACTVTLVITGIIRFIEKKRIEDKYKKKK